MKINVPEKVKYIIQVLMEHGYEAYAVGGCVRDSILGRIPGDWDITTSASPYEVKQLFHRTIDTGIQHGTVTVMLDKEGFEVTTYRLDGEYEDCRHPKQVEFTKSLKEDLKRRDFTINAMAYNDEDGMVDLFEGLEDIKKKRIRCVGKAEDRFEEDALRILRAVRFSAQINFEIEQETRDAIVVKAKNLANISAERIREELNKLFLSSHPERLSIAYETGITGVVLSEFDQKMKSSFQYQDHTFEAGEFVLQTLGRISKESEALQKMYEVKSQDASMRQMTKKEHLCLSYAALLWNPDQTDEICDQEADAAKKVMQRLKFDNETIGIVTKLVRFSHTAIEESPASVRQAMNRMGVDIMDLWFVFQRIIRECMHQGADDAACKEIESLYQIYEEVKAHGDCVTLKELALNGRDLIQMGCTPGVTLGVILERLLQHVLIHPEDNKKEVLTQIAKRHFE